MAEEKKNLQVELEKYVERAKEIFVNEKSGHDFSHIQRVLNYCEQIQKTEGGDGFVVFVSALFHDVHRVLQSQLGRFISSDEAMPEVEKILSEFDIPQEKLKQILFNIRHHDNKGLQNLSIELQILQDADILDALGEVGLKRTQAYCKKHNIPAVDKSLPLDCPEYIPDIFPISTTHYVFRTMIPNQKLLHTKAGRKIGENQVQVLCDYVEKNWNEV
ncbi:MAG: HD domain-containing protein [Clostridia bacterium]|nr:HD domain-containing protein [Clostridia bacterium]